MSRRLRVLLLSTWFAVPGLALADALTPEQIARIRRDEQAAIDRVNAAHGNKKSSELSTAERREIIREQQAAVRKVMESHGVSAKDYARQTARMGPKGNAAVSAEQKALEDRQKAAQETKAPGEIQVQQGFDENNPVMLEEQEGAPPIVEQGLPPDMAPEQTDLPAVESGLPEGQADVPEGK